MAVFNPKVPFDKLTIFAMASLNLWWGLIDSLGSANAFSVSAALFITCVGLSMVDKP